MLAASCLAFWCPTPASAADLKLSNRWLASEDARDLAARVFIRELRKHAPQLSLAQQTPAGFNLAAGTELDAILAGRIDMAVLPLADAVPKIPELSVVLMPGVPSDLEAAAQLKGSKFHELLQELTEENGFRILTWWWLPGGFVSADKPIKWPAAVTGMKVNGGQPNFDRLLKVAGAVPEKGAFSDVIRFSPASTVQGGFITFETIAAERVTDRARYVTGGGYRLWMTLMPLIISKKVWDRLSDTERQAFELAADVSDRFFEDSQSDVEQRAALVVAQEGGKLDQLGWPEYEAWMRLAKDASWLEYRRLSPTANELFLMMVENVIRPSAASRQKGQRP